MYWTEGTVIKRADLDGGAVEILVTVPPREGLTDIALDPANGKMYWTVPNNRYIVRANLDGSGRETVITSEFGRPHHVSLDVPGGKIYWTDEGIFPVPNSIRRANLDGTNVETLIIGKADSIALDLSTVYDSWLSSNLDNSPFEPFHNCIRLGENTLSTDLCGDSGPLTTVPLLGVSGLDLRIGYVPCQSQNLLFIGTSFEGESLPFGGNAISASIIGLSQGITLGVEGFENADCSSSPTSEGNPYAVGSVGPVSEEAKRGTRSSCEPRRVTGGRARTSGKYSERRQQDLRSVVLPEFRFSSL